MVISKVGVTLFFQHCRCKPQGKMAGALLITCVILSAIYTFLTSQEGSICFPVTHGRRRAQPAPLPTWSDITFFKKTLLSKCLMSKQKTC